MNTQHTHAEILAPVLDPLRRLYRNGTVKPGAIALEPAQFDALLDLHAAAPDLLAATSDMLGFITHNLPAAAWQNEPWLQPAVAKTLNQR